uniref:Vicilin-like seed storage protein At2g28490 n=1 Tax=Tanacetum cinerariifolium TaxID=118510 RepID=A0A6L2K1W2_TANCI|nr:vicilin-like seed storage protein At2g28490 [Tanacetum cinerariifolium]
MAKVSSKWLFILLALLVVVVLGVSGQGTRGRDIPPYPIPPGKQFPPGGPGSRGSGSGGRDFPPEEPRGGSGGRDFPPEEPRGGSGGRDFSPEEEEPRGSGSGGRGWTDMRKFILSDTKRVVATDAGGMRVVKGVGGRFSQSPMHIGFITMEPNSMFIPQYLDSSLIIFVELGEARIGSIYNDDLVEQDLKSGDLYRIQAGSAFYLVNKAQGQRLHIITSIDTAESTDLQPFQSFYLGGGTSPTSVLAGFDRQTLATAFNVSFDALGELLSNRQEGAIVFLNPDGSEPEREPNMWKRFLEQGTHERKSQMKKIVNTRRKAEKEVEEPTWSLRSLWISLLGENKKTSTSLDAYNIYDRKADFRNDYDRMADILNAQTETTILPSAAVSPGGGDEEIPEGGGDRQAGGDDQPQGEAELLMKKMDSKIRMKQSSFAYNMAMGMD